ncbi:hypothetical protein B0H14DRAFT_2596570 [Mycena olivaceomarginata]|nr:hypothetical protein B0H14DRAFT_2596570 [Mycena olivaceomarginata]
MPQLGQTESIKGYFFKQQSFMYLRVLCTKFYASPWFKTRPLQVSRVINLIPKRKAYIITLSNGNQGVVTNRLIVREIDDLESLKACSLVVSTLRHTSQHILFNSLTIDIKNFTAIRDLLTGSPHIAHYITSLRALLAGLDVESFGRILPKLQNVRKCFLDGVWHSSRQSGAPLRSGIPPIILDFFTRQPLRTLGLMSIHIPIAVLRNLVKIIPTLYFLAVGIEDGADAVPAHTVSQPPVERFALNSLFLIGNDVGQFLAHPHNISCVAALRHLSVCPQDNGWAGALIEGASSTLNHIEFNCSSYPPPALPHLPALRTVGFTFSGQIIPSARADIISQTANVLSTLAVPQMSPALAKIVIIQEFARDGVFDPSPYLSLITMLDEALAAYPMPVSIGWTLRLNDGETQFKHFADSVRRGMPKAHSVGRLLLEAYVPSTIRIKKVGGYSYYS